MQLRLVAGEVRDALVPFSDDPTQAKRRPVIVIGWSPMGPDEDQSVLVVPVTSFGGAPKPRNGHIPLDWQAAGLAKPSWAAPRRVFGAHPRALKPPKVRGNITDNEMALILLELEHMLLPTSN